MPYIQGPQFSEEFLVVREMVPIRTDRLSVREPGTYGNHAIIGQAQNNGYSANIQEIPVSMENVCPEGTEAQYVTSPSGESLGRNSHVRRSEHIIKYPQQYDPGFGASREWKNEAVSSIVYMIQYGDLNINVDTDDILFLMAEWYAEDCMDTS